MQHGFLPYALCYGDAPSAVKTSAHVDPGCNQQYSCLQVIVVLVLVVLVPLYYWYMLQPFYKTLGKESRRVAELLSQLPKSIDVQGNTQAVIQLHQQAMTTSHAQLTVESLVFTGMVAEAMAVQLPSSKSAPVITNKPKRRSFWHVPFFRHKGPAYQSLKDVDSPVKNKGSELPSADETTDDVPLLKTGGPIKTKYQEKLSRRAASDDDEAFVPRPNTRIKFNLPDSKAVSSEEGPQTATEPDMEPVTVPVTGAVTQPATEAASDVAAANSPQEDDLISASMSGPSAAADLGSEDAPVVNDFVPSNDPSSRTLS